jgi:phosphatidate phosphatase APP1
MRHLKLVDSDKLNLIAKLQEFIEHTGSQTHKLGAITTLLKLSPSTQRFIMVGDSGEFDPEVRRDKNRSSRIFSR